VVWCGVALHAVAWGGVVACRMAWHPSHATACAGFWSGGVE
jgi:hypothetical protein